MQTTLQLNYKHNHNRGLGKGKSVSSHCKAQYCKIIQALFIHKETESCSTSGYGAVNAGNGMKGLKYKMVTKHQKFLQQVGQSHTPPPLQHLDVSGLGLTHQLQQLPQLQA